MSERKTFSDLKKGDVVELRKDPDKKGVEKKVTTVSTDKYGQKISLGENFVFVVDKVTATFMTEFFDQRNRCLYLIAQPSKAGTKSSE